MKKILARALVLVSVTVALTSEVRAQQVVPSIEGYPPSVIASLEVRDRARRNVPQEIEGFAPQFVFRVANKWVGTSGHEPKITVAFAGGDEELRQAIARAASEWSTSGHFAFEFKDPATGRFHEWSPNDTKYQADIRIGFGPSGYWSLVGTDSIDPIVAKPGQPSMNFANFTVAPPSDWKTVVQHEFGHALGLEHEHQAPVGGCDADWRWNDDPGYTPTTNNSGWYVQDPNGKRPGIYTFLGGYSNYWPTAVVDQNLRQLNNDDHAYDQGPFDKTSIMKYYFPPFMFTEGENSHCYSSENLTISTQDQQGIAKWYPVTGPDLFHLQDIQRRVLRKLVEIQASASIAREPFEGQATKLQ